MTFKSFLHALSYFSIRAFLFPFSLLPYKWIHLLGKGLGIITFPFLTRYRKRALSNLSIASDLNYSNLEIEILAKESLGNLFTVALEYGKLSREKNIQRIAECVNPEEADKIRGSGKGIIFFCAHQANWELLFLEGTSRMKGIAIGQPVANKFLYNWILRIREKFGGKIIEPKQSVKEGLKALKKGVFLGIVGDQGLPDGGYLSSFLGRPAYTSPLPALLSHRSGSPIIFASTTRKEGKYIIRYSPAIWPSSEKTMDEDIPILMDQALNLLETSIRWNPGQWLWQHNKWKQQGPGRLKKSYRQDTIAVFLPLDETLSKGLIEELKVLREIYPTEFISFFLPKEVELPEKLATETIHYTKPSHLKRKDYRFKLVFNLTSNSSLNKHYLGLSAFKVLTLDTIAKISKQSDIPLSSQLKKVILNAS
jgi:Kdo2-lipid IVA lauroyltransferase/acyltransferase